MRREDRPRSGVEEKAVDVIVVEDDEGARAMLLALFVSAECHVRTFDGAAAAREGALRRIPDVVVTDLRLPGGEAGWELAESLRAEPRTRHVALVAVTGEVEPERRIVAPFDAYLRKPVETRFLVDLVRQLARIARAQRREAIAR